MPRVLPVDVVEAIVSLLGEIAGVSESLVMRRTRLLEGLAKLIDADVWMWYHCRIVRGQTYPAPFKVLSGGWRDKEEFQAVTAASGDLELVEPQRELLASQVHRTCTDEQVYRQDAANAFQRAIAKTGMDRLMFSVYPLGDSTVSGVGLHRRVGKPAYTPIERCIVHVVLSQIDWLHRADIDVPANDGRLAELTPRLRQTLMFLLMGDSRKQIAVKMNLSPHTVSDHMKSLYRLYGVNSRGELLSLFIAGGK